MRDRLTVLLSALDEEAVIQATLDEFRRQAEELVAAGTIGSFELVVVDDGSTDQTAAIVAAVAAEDDRVMLCSHGRNRGVGAAVRTGLAAASGTLVLYTDADLPIDLADVGPALGVLERPGVGMVAGRRRSYESSVPIRAFGARAYDWGVRMVLGIPEHDINFPFKLLRTETARSLGLRSEGAFVDAEMLARVHANGERVEQVWMDFTERTAGESKTLRPRLLARLARELAEHGPELRRCVRSGTAAAS